MERKYIDYTISISEDLYNILEQYIHETEYDREDDQINTLDLFITEAIIEKFNNENELFDGEINENGFTDNRSITEHYLGINKPEN